MMTWQETQKDEIEATGLAPSDPSESAILATVTGGEGRRDRGWGKRHHRGRADGSLQAFLLSVGGTSTPRWQANLGGRACPEPMFPRRSATPCAK